MGFRTLSRPQVRQTLSPHSPPTTAPSSLRRGARPASRARKRAHVLSILSLFARHTPHLSREPGTSHYGNTNNSNSEKSKLGHAASENPGCTWCGLVAQAAICLHHIWSNYRRFTPCDPGLARLYHRHGTGVAQAQVCFRRLPRKNPPAAAIVRWALLMALWGAPEGILDAHGLDLLNV